MNDSGGYPYCLFFEDLPHDEDGNLSSIFQGKLKKSLSKLKGYELDSLRFRKSNKRGVYFGVANFDSEENALKAKSKIYVFNTINNCQMHCHVEKNLQFNPDPCDSLYAQYVPNDLSKDDIKSELSEYGLFSLIYKKDKYNPQYHYAELKFDTTENASKALDYIRKNNPFGDTVKIDFRTIGRMGKVVKKNYNIKSDNSLKEIDLMFVDDKQITKDEKTSITPPINNVDNELNEVKEIKEVKEEIVKDDNKKEDHQFILPVFPDIQSKKDNEIIALKFQVANLTCEVNSLKQKLDMITDQLSSLFNTMK